MAQWLCSEPLSLTYGRALDLNCLGGFVCVLSMYVMQRLFWGWEEEHGNERSCPLTGSLPPTPTPLPGDGALQH